MRKTIFLLLFLNLAHAAPGGRPDTRCKIFDDPLPWAYCATTTEGSTSGDLLYYLHGLGGSEESWQNDAGVIRQAWADARLEAPLVVTISFGQVWLLALRNESHDSGLYELFTRQLMLLVEKDLGWQPAPGHERLLYGMSMGGFNAAQLVLREPARFARVALACPAIASVSPFASPEEIDAYLARTKADPRRVQAALMITRKFFPDVRSWEASAPLAEAMGLRLDAATPPLHVSCGLEDEYGFFEGARAFAELARNNGVREMRWQQFHGGHCTIDPVAIARFLVRDH